MGKKPAKIHDKVENHGYSGFQKTQKMKNCKIAESHGYFGKRKKKKKKEIPENAKQLTYMIF